MARMRSSSGSSIVVLMTYIWHNLGGKSIQPGFRQCQFEIPAELYLAVVFTDRRKRCRVVPAYEMNPSERKPIKERAAQPASSQPGDWYSTSQGRAQTLRELTLAIKDGKLVRSKGSSIAKTNPRILDELMEDARSRPFGKG